MNIYKVDSIDDFKPLSENWEYSGNYNVTSSVKKTFLGIFKYERIYRRTVNPSNNSSKKKVGF